MDARRAALLVPRRPEPWEAYHLSPASPELRTRAWIEFLGFPSNHWTEPAAAGCVVRFSALTHFDRAAFRRSGRMVVEARVTRLADVPRRITIMEAVPGGARHQVRLVVLSAEPASDEEVKGKKMKKGGSAMPGSDHGGSKVGTEERPESLPGVLTCWPIPMSMIQP